MNLRRDMGETLKPLGPAFGLQHYFAANHRYERRRRSTL